MLRLNCFSCIETLWFCVCVSEDVPPQHTSQQFIAASVRTSHSLSLAALKYDPPLKAVGLICVRSDERLADLLSFRSVLSSSESSS